MCSLGLEEGGWGKGVLSETNGRTGVRGGTGNNSFFACLRHFYPLTTHSFRDGVGWGAGDVGRAAFM